MKVVLAAGVPETEFSQTFVQGMANRMSLSFLKYGAVADAYPEKVNALESMQVRLAKYAATGNTEFLEDAANFLMIEFMHPRHPEAYFAGTDSKDSPGRVWNTGHVGQDANTHATERGRQGKLYQRDGD